MTPFPTLERMPDLFAVRAEWGAGMADALEPFSTFFRPFPTPASYFPCPRHCGCAHQIIRFPDGSIIGRCRCRHWNCEDLSLTEQDITLWELNWPKLARAICQALGLTSKFEEFGPNTAQIGTWSTDAVPAFLTIQWDEREFRHVVASLVARQQGPFILFAPTSTHMDATSQSYLANAGAEFFSLETHLNLTEHGTFQPTKAPGEIFARFRPDPKEEMDEDEARRIFAIIEKLEAESRRKAPSALTVFRIYCMEEMSAQEVSRKCHCSKATIINRLNLIHAGTGVHPKELRRLSMHFAKIEDDITDSRAKSIHRKSAIYGDEGADDHS